MSFIEKIRSWPDSHQPSLPESREALRELLDDISASYIGQDDVVRRVVQAVVVGGHTLLEGRPGEGKTKCVELFARGVGLKGRRVQFRPDMMPSDLLGTRLLKLKDGKPRLKWVRGPVFTHVLIADEINRAPSKVQAALLEAMQERQNSRLDHPTPETLYPRKDRKDLEDLEGARKEGQLCFGVELPTPDDTTRVPFTVFATQNPVEMEGTYPLSEAATDRFFFKLLVPRPAITAGDDILRVNARPPARGPGLGTQTPLSPLPDWIRTGCFFEHVRRKLFLGVDSAQDRLLRDRRGLWDRVRLVIYLSHYRSSQPGEVPEADRDLLPAPLRDRDQEDIRVFLGQWLTGSGGTVRQAVQRLLTNRLFEYVEAGSSTRGLLAWPRAAAAEALMSDDLEGDTVVLRRRHFRAVAEDVLRHRIRLSPQARADTLRPEDLIRSLVNTLLPEAEQEAREDGIPLLR